MPFTNQKSPSAPIVYGDVSINPSDGSVTATEGNFQLVTLNGVDITSMFDGIPALPIGSLWLHRIEGTMPGVTNGYVTLINKTFPLAGDRDYLFVTSPLRIQYGGGFRTASSAYLEIAVTPGTGNTTTQPNIRHVVYAIDRFTPQTFSTVPSVTLSIPRPTVWPGGNATFTARLYVPVTPTKWALNTSEAPPEMSLYDMGSISGRQYSRFDLSSVTDTGTTPTPDPAPEPSTKTYTGTWYATDSANYSVNSGQRQDFPGLLRQSTLDTIRAGYNTYSAARNSYGHTMATLGASNVSVKKAVLYVGENNSSNFKPVRWYYSSGGIGMLYWHGYETLRPTYPGGLNFVSSIPDWNNGQVKAINLTGSALAALQAGTFRGIAFSGHERRGQNTYHGEFPARTRLVVTYTITE